MTSLYQKIKVDKKNILDLVESNLKDDSLNRNHCCQSLKHRHRHARVCLCYRSHFSSLQIFPLALHYPASSLNAKLSIFLLFS